MDGYTGWIKSEKIDGNFNNITSCKIVIKSKLKDIYLIINGTSPIRQVSMGTELYCLNKANNWYEVALPMNSKGWIESTDTLQIQPESDITETNGSELVKPDKNSMKAGDLIFFSSKINSKEITHVGIYIGNNKFMHASGKAGVVTITSLSDNYYKERIAGVKRPFFKASD